MQNEILAIASNMIMQDRHRDQQIFCASDSGRVSGFL